jgi:hypothetical protein
MLEMTCVVVVHVSYDFACQYMADSLRQLPDKSMLEMIGICQSRLGGAGLDCTRCMADYIVKLAGIWPGRPAWWRGMIGNRPAMNINN